MSQARFCPYDEVFYADTHEQVCCWICGRPRVLAHLENPKFHAPCEVKVRGSDGDTDRSVRDLRSLPAPA